MATALTLLLITGPHALAAGECQLGFERWAKLSKARLRTSLPSDDRGACLDSESVRRELLDGLARNRMTCEGATSSSEQSPQQTMTMIEINDGFIRSLGICPKEEGPATGAEWTAKLQTAEPKPVTPPVAPPVTATTTKLTSAPKSVAPPVTPATPKLITAPKPGTPPVAPATAKLITAPKPGTPPVAPARGCLDVEHAKAGPYTLINRRCAGQVVLAVVETRDAAGKTACKAFNVSGTVTVGTDMTAALNVNHQCVLDRGTCTPKHVGNMFPECDW
jgi:hypothetical protein